MKRQDRKSISLYLVAGLCLFAPARSRGDNLSWAINLDNSALTFSALECVNGINVCGTVVNMNGAHTNGFTQFTVAASATVSGQSCTTSQGDHSISLDGASYLAAPSSSSFNNLTGNALTVEAWFKTTASAKKQAIVERFGTSGSDGGFFLRLTNTGNLAFATVQNSGVYTQVVGATTVSTGVWHHAAGVYDGANSTAWIYLDGVADGSVTSSQNPVSGTTSVYVGAGGNTHGYNFSGLIDEVRITGDVVYPQGTTFVPGTQLGSCTGATAAVAPTAIWKFNQGTGSLSDFTTNANNLSGFGSPAFSTDTPAGGDIAPAIPTTFYGLQVPGISIVTYPILTNEKEVAYSVTAGSCPLPTLNSNFMFMQEDPSGLNHFDDPAQPGSGILTWSGSSGSVTKVFSTVTGAPTTVSLGLTGGSCSVGGANIPGAGDRGGALYTNTTGSAMIRTNANKGLFVLPAIPIQDVRELNGNYAVLSTTNGLNGTPGYNSVSGAVNITNYRLTVDSTGVNTSGTTVNLGANTAGTNACLSFTDINRTQSGVGTQNGFVRASFVTGGSGSNCSGGTAPVTLLCAIYLTSQNTIFCNGSDPSNQPSSLSNAINLMMVSDQVPIYRGNAGLYATAGEFQTWYQQGLAVATDAANVGKLYVTGTVSAYNGTSVGNLFRLNTDASLDTTFAIGTGLDVNWTGAAAGTPVSGTQLLPDPINNGRIYVGGQFQNFNGSAQNRIVAINADGSNDSAHFSIGTSFNAAVLSLTAGGSLFPNYLYVGGTFTSYGGNSVGKIARIASNGTWDSSFAPGTGFDGSVYGTAVDSSGRVYAVGTMTKWQGSSWMWGLARLTSAGAKDATFGAAGLGTDSSVMAVQIDPSSGNIYIGGFFTKWYDTGSCGSGCTKKYVARILTNGRLDSTFTASASINNPAYTLRMDPANTGKLYVGGGFTGEIARLNSDGSLDTAFPNGATAFGGGSTAANTSVYTLAPDATGANIYVFGSFSNFNGNGSYALAKMTSAGTMDTTYQIGGQGFDAPVWSVATAIDPRNLGKIYLGGIFDTYNNRNSSMIIRLNLSGTPDWSFNVGSGFSAGTNTVGWVQAVAPALATNDMGKIYAVGKFTTYQGTAENNIARVNSDGSLDTTFNVGSTGLTGSISGGNVYEYAVSPVTSADSANFAKGAVYVGGDFTSHKGTAARAIARINSDGSLDTTFVVSSTKGPNSVVYSIAQALDNAGKLYIGGAFTTYNDGSSHSSSAIARLSTAGAWDSTFAVGSAFNQIVYTVAAAVDATYGGSNGYLYAGGAFTSYSGTSTGEIARIGPNGVIDATFKATGASRGFTGGNEVKFILPQTNGQIYVGGTFTTYNDGSAHTVNGIVRLQSDGTLDTTFATGTGFDVFYLSQIFSGVPSANGGPSWLALANDPTYGGSVYVGGSFSKYAGSPGANFVRLTTTGAAY